MSRRARGPEVNVEAFSVYHSIMGFFEWVCILLRREDVDIDMVEDLLDIPAVSIWEKFNDFVIASRERNDWPHLFANFEYLVDFWLNGRRDTRKNIEYFILTSHARGSY